MLGTKWLQIINQTCLGVFNHDRLSSRSPNRSIVPVVARIIEALLPELTHQPFSFGFARKIDDSVACKNRIEELQMIRHLSGDLHVASGGQDDAAPLRALDFQVVQQILPIRKSTDVQ